MVVGTPVCILFHQEVSQDVKNTTSKFLSFFITSVSCIAALSITIIDIAIRKDTIFDEIIECFTIDTIMNDAIN